MKETIALIVFYVASVSEGVLCLPQIYKLLKTKSSEDLSKISQCINLAMSILWVTYWLLCGVTLTQMVAQTIVFAEILAQTILVFAYSHKRKERNEEL